MQVLISGERVFLRHPRLQDEAEFVAARQASRHLHERWEPRPTDGTDPTGREAFLRLVEHSNTERHQKHLVCRIEDGRIGGYVGLNEIVRGAFQGAYLGYWTAAAFSRRGYATEAVGLAIERAFTQLGLHRVEANIIPGNAASLGVARRCGLRREGYSPRYLQIAGDWQDHERWALTIEDWSVSVANRSRRCGGETAVNSEEPERRPI